MPTVLITGAASGIGRAASHRFAHAGWRCVLVDRNADALSALVPTLRPTAEPHVSIPLDLTDADAIARLGEAVPALDALVNNAGMSDTSGTALVEQTPEQQARLVALNLKAPAAMVQALAGRLGAGARIVNVSSGAGLRAIPWRGMYSPTKAGVITQSKALARAARTGASPCCARASCARSSSRASSLPGA
ncbi:SDR family NAD(P)-dependent oxidoreductase [Verticiella alkaliphila]|uniref:SDR family NAD(P)-dependent oxidoreductase n=1 Tax=Verticiella alkaliphila TaxID=2779529 RepID=UPI00209ADB9A|nr:SDR family NAD(P)-dependent oxidoreductase [Verticiella sp. GG226]